MCIKPSDMKTTKMAREKSAQMGLRVGSYSLPASGIVWCGVVGQLKKLAATGRSSGGQGHPAEFKGHR
jgi:hypothetical protein